MKKGLIICGYPGIGKSSIAGWNNCIDLESSLFSHYKDSCRKSDDIWVGEYCNLAYYLALQGYTVMTSTHMAVIDYFDRFKVTYYKDVPIVIFCPRYDMKKAWAIRLVNRYLNSENEKDLRAFQGAIKDWDKKLDYYFRTGLLVHRPDEIDYDLRDYILKIRKKEGCDDEETGSPMEAMVGVEGTRLDVPVVEESTDISRDHSE